VETAAAAGGGHALQQESHPDVVREDENERADKKDSRLKDEVLLQDYLY